MASQRVDVRFGSIADIRDRDTHVRCTLRSRYEVDAPRCPLRVMTGRRRCLGDGRRGRCDGRRWSTGVPSHGLSRKGRAVAATRKKRGNFEPSAARAGHYSAAFGKFVSKLYAEGNMDSAVGSDSWRYFFVADWETHWRRECWPEQIPSRQ